MASDSTAVAIYKLAMESQQYVASAQAAMQANQGLAASAAPVAAGEEKIDKALRGGEAALDRKIARFDAASRINVKYAKELADLAKIEEAGIGTPEKRAKALAVVTAAQERELAALDKVKKANAENAAALGGQNAALSSAAAAGDRYAKALLEMAAKQAQLNKDLQAGDIGLAEHARLLNLTREAYQSQAAGISIQEAQMRKSATATGLARYEIINLSRQLQDIGVSLAGGQSPFRVLIEQGSQIADVFISSKAKLVEVFAGIGTAIRSIGTGAVVGVIGGFIAALVAGAAAAGSAWSSARKEIELSMLGIGAASGVTIDKIEEIAVSSRKMWGGLSVSEAREFAAALAATGVVGEESIEKMTKAGKDLATMLGVTSTEAVKTLVKTLQTADPSELNKRTGSFDAPLLRSIQILREQGKIMEANDLIVANLVEHFGGVADKAGFVSKAWTAAGNIISDRWTKLGAMINQVMGTDVAEGSEAAIGRLKKQLQDLQDLRARGGGVGPGFEAQEAAINKELERQVALREKNLATTEATRAVLISQADIKIIRDLVPDIAMFEKLRVEAEQTAAALERVKAAQASGKPQGPTDVTVQQAALAAERAAVAQATALGQAEKLTAQHQAQLAAINARTAAEHDAAITEQTILDMAGQRLSVEERQLQITRAVTEERARQAAETRDMIFAAEQQATVSRAIPGPQRGAAEDEARRQELLRQNKTITEATAITEAERAAKIAAANAQIEQQNHSLAQGTRLAEAEAQGMGAVEKSAQAAENAIRAGADNTGAAAAATAVWNAEMAKIALNEMKAARAHEASLASIEARTQGERIAAAEQQAYVQALNQGLSIYEATNAARRAGVEEERKLSQVHKDNMAALQDQLSVAQARTDAARLSAQEEADINTRLREGATLMEAQEEAATRRAIAEESLKQKAQQQDAKNEADRQRYIEEYRRAAEQATEQFLKMGAQMRENNKLAGNAVELWAKLSTIGTGLAKVTRDIGNVNFADIQSGPIAAGGGLVGAAGMSVALNVDLIGILGRGLISAINNIPAKQAEAGMQTIIDAIQRSFDPEAQKAAAQAAEDAAKAQQDAAKAAEDAAKAQEEAAKAAREAYINQLDEAVKDIVATKLLAGQSAQAVNMLIEGGAIQFGTASTRFQTQLDLYKRAGASNAQIAADIRAGVIGEGVRPSELLQALDSLKDAVDANTAAQIGLSDFYTQQGDRLLGYRGYNVQTGIRSPVGGTGAGAGAIGGVIGGGDMGGGMGGIINPPSQVAAEFIPGAGAPSGIVTLRRILNGMIVDGYYDANGQWITTTIISVAPGMTAPANTAGVPVTGGAPTTSFGRIGSSIPTGPSPSAAYSRFAEGGVVSQPSFGIFGEAGPEAFVPLKGGAIPVRFAANQNRPTNVININAPLVHFAAEPTRDEVRQSAFQASQILRRVAAGD